jgi:hypothetical protein
LPLPAHRPEILEELERERVETCLLVERNSFIESRVREKAEPIYLVAKAVAVVLAALILWVLKRLYNDDPPLE